jgi:hypothetical protein
MAQLKLRIAPWVSKIMQSPRLPTEPNQKQVNEKGA